MADFSPSYIPQYRTTTLDKVGGLTEAETAGIKLASIPSDLDITKGGWLALTYSNPIDTSKIEWIYYSSIDGSNVLQGVVRGAEGWVAKTHLNGCTIGWVFSKSHINEIMDAITGVKTGVTLTSPTIVTPKITTSINDANGNEVIKTPATASAVNEITVTNAAAGSSPIVSATGGDDNINLKLSGKGTGTVQFYDQSSASYKSIGSASFWTDVPGTPTRVSDTQFTITDTSNANYYDLLLKKGTILKWMESTTFQTAMVISSSYGTNTVTVNIVGDSLTAGFTGMKYAANMAMCETFIIPGTLAALTDAAKTWYTPCPAYFLSADLYVKTAGTGTGSNIIDINDDGTTKWTTKPTVTTGTSDIDNVADNPSTVVAEGSIITLDIDAVTATTAAVEAYVYLWWYPQSWQYRS